MLEARRNAYCYGDSEAEGEADGEKDDLRLFESVGCFLHDLANGIKWGVQSDGAKDQVDNLYKAMESCRNLFLEIHAHLQEFLSKHVVFDRTDVPIDAEMAFWKAIGVPADWLDDYCRVGMKWKNNVLHVSKELDNNPEGYQMLLAVWLHSMVWQTFSDTRWLQVGTSARIFLRTLCMGLDGLVSCARAGGSYEYKGHNYDKLGSEERFFNAVCALSAYPCEALEAHVLHDDRVARNIDELTGLAKEELQYLEEVPDSVWDRCADTTDKTGKELRSETLRAAHASLAYVWKTGMETAQGLPWSLGRGDVEQKLLDLKAAADEPLHPTVARIYRLLRSGWHVQQNPYTVL